MYYQKNRLRAQFKNTKPTKTEQSGAKETDINVIIRRHLVTNQAPGSSKPLLAGDFTQLPRDLRGFLEVANSVERLKAKLPDELKGKTTAELLALTPNELTSILAKPTTPPATPPASPPATPPATPPA